MGFDRLIPRLKSFMEIHLHDLERWRSGEPSQKRHRSTVEEHHLKIAKFVFYCSEISNKNRAKKYSKAMAIKSLKKLTEIFDK